MAQQIELPSCVDHFYFPPVHCSIPARCSPFLDACLQACEECAKGDDTVKEGARFICWVAPGAEDLDRMILASKLIGALFAMDDNVGESEVPDEKLVDMIVEVVQGHADSSSDYYTDAGDYEYKPGELISKNFPQFALLVETVRELRSRAHPSLYSRFARHMTEYLRPAREGACGASLCSTVQEFMSVRMDDALAWGTLCVLEFCHVGGREVTTEPLLKALCRVAGWHACLVNDLFSFRKEYYAGVWANRNVLAVLYRESRGRGGFQAAVDRCCQIIGEAETDLLSLRDQLLAREDLSEELRQLALEVPYLASGNLQNSATSPRYNGPSNTLLTGHVYHGTLLMHPRATVILPPGPPTAAGGAAPPPAHHHHHLRQPPVLSTAHKSNRVIRSYKPLLTIPVNTLARPSMLRSSFNIAAQIHVHPASGRQQPLTFVL